MLGSIFYGCHFFHPQNISPTSKPRLPASTSRGVRCTRWWCPTGTPHLVRFLKWGSVETVWFPYDFPIVSYGFPIISLWFPYDFPKKRASSSDLRNQNFLALMKGEELNRKNPRLNIERHPTKHRWSADIAPWHTVDGSEIPPSPVEVGSLSHYLQEFWTNIPANAGSLPSTVPPQEIASLMIRAY